MEKSKLNIVAAILFVLQSFVVVFSNLISLNLYQLIISVVSLVLYVLIAINIINIKKENANKVIVLFILSFITGITIEKILLFGLLLINLYPKLFKYKETINKLWFLPCIIKIASYVLNLISSQHLNLIYLISTILSAIGILCLSKWIIINPYNLTEEDTSNLNYIFNKKTWIIITVIVIIISFVGMAYENKHRYDNVFNKDPNTWTEDDEDYVNNFFDWIVEQDKKDD